MLVKESRITFLSIFGAFFLLGDLVSGSCTPNTYMQCSEISSKAVKDWAESQTQSVAELKTLCRANEDAWTCMLNNLCDVTDLRSLYDRARQACRVSDTIMMNATLHQEVDGCNLLANVRCTEGPVNIIKEWSLNPTSSTYNINQICKANDDIWNCLVTTKCEMPELKVLFNRNKDKCAQLKSGSGTTFGISTHLIISLGFVLFGLVALIVGSVIRHNRQLKQQTSSPYSDTRNLV